MAVKDIDAKYFVELDKPLQDILSQIQLKDDEAKRSKAILLHVSNNINIIFSEELFNVFFLVIFMKN